MQAIIQSASFDDSQNQFFREVCNNCIYCKISLKLRSPLNILTLFKSVMEYIGQMGISMGKYNIMKNK